MNVELLQKVKAAILGNPWEYNQHQFCGTTFCIGGHAVAIAEPHTWKRAKEMGLWKGEELVYDAARRLLDMRESDYEELTDPPGDWPPLFRDQYRAANTPEERAAVGAAMIDRFIAKDAQQ